MRNKGASRAERIHRATFMHYKSSAAFEYSSSNCNLRFIRAKSFVQQRVTLYRTSMTLDVMEKDRKYHKFLSM